MKSADQNWFQKRGMKFMHLNIHYLCPKLDEIKILLSKHNIDVVGLGETFLNDMFADNEFQLHNYSLFRKDRKTNGGGIAVYVKNEYLCERRLDIECDNLEIMWLEVKPSNQKTFILGYVYRPPSSSKSWT